MEKYAVVEAETGLVYEDNLTRDEAEKLIRAYLKEDHENGEEAPIGYILKNTTTGEKELINC